MISGWNLSNPDTIPQQGLVRVSIYAMPLIRSSERDQITILQANKTSLDEKKQVNANDLVPAPLGEVAAAKQQPRERAATARTLADGNVWKTSGGDLFGLGQRESPTTTARLSSSLSLCSSQRVD